MTGGIACALDAEQGLASSLPNWDEHQAPDSKLFDERGRYAGWRSSHDDAVEGHGRFESLKAIADVCLNILGAD